MAPPRRGRDRPHARSIRRRLSLALGGTAVALAFVAGPGSDTGAGEVKIESFTLSVNQNLITLEWRVRGGDRRVYIYGSGGVYATDGSTSDDVGFREQPCSGCSASTPIYVNRGGVHRFTLEAVTPDGRRKATLSREIDVPMPPVPSVSPTRVDVDMFNVQERTLRWSSPGASCIVVDRPGGMTRVQDKDGGARFCEPPRLPPAGSIQIPRHELTVGRHTYKLKSCLEPYARRPYCGLAVPVTYVVGPSGFDPPYRQFTASAGAPFTVSWKPSSGNAWYVSVPDLAFESPLLTQPTFTFPKGVLKPGLHEVRLASCRRLGKRFLRCSDRSDGKGRAGKVIPKGERNGTDAYSTMELVVGMPHSVASWSLVRINQAFSVRRYDFTDRPATGSPLDVTFDASGSDIWSIGEFSSAVMHVQNGVPTHHDVPLARVPKNGIYQRVRPFGDRFTTGTTVLTTNAERIVDVGRYIWFVQGGDSVPNPGGVNHSRIVRFDTTAQDAASTPDDDRFCVVHVPGNDNLAYGVEWDGSRIWIAESYLRRSSVLGWFYPSEYTGTCDNFLDYERPVPDDFNLCRGATQTRCVHQRQLSNNGLAQLKWDPWIHCLWFTDYTGKLGRYCPAGDELALFPLPASHRTGGPNSMFHGFPWQLAVDEQAVYVGEFRDNDLVRFDKRRATWSELFVPVFWHRNKIHSLASYAGRLYFTMASDTENPDDPDGSYFGFVDLATWQKNLESPAPARTPITGALYAKASSLSRSLPGHSPVFNGIDVSERGEIALADMDGKIWRLTPAAR